MKHELLTLYARQEPSTEPIAKRYARPDLVDIVIYKDARAHHEFARFDCLSRQQPRKGSKIITINCWKYRLHWLPPLHTETPKPH